MLNRKFLSILFSSFITLLLIAAPASAESEWEGNIHVIYGKRAYGNWDKKSFSGNNDDFSNQDVLGIEVDAGPDTWPVNLWVGYTRSEKSIDIENVDFTSTVVMNEYYAGVRTHLPFFFVSGGVSSIGGDISGGGQTVTLDREAGLLLNAGFQTTLFMISGALDARALMGTDHSDYFQVALKAGLTF